MNPLRVVIITAVFFVLTAGWALAQRGVGDPVGVARQGDALPVQTLSGTVVSIEVGACEQTTGRSPQGVHLLVDTDEGERINLHLGPLFAVDHLVDQMEDGLEISFDAFRTDALPDDAFIARTLRFDGKSVQLRDDSLRPSWAYGQGAGRGRGMGQGQGRGFGRCW